MAETETDRRDALVERLFENTIGALELFSVHLGWRLGLYAALRDAQSLTAGELAAAAGIDAALRARVARAAGGRGLPRRRRRGRDGRDAALPAPGRSTPTC